MASAPSPQPASAKRFRLVAEATACLQACQNMQSATVNGSPLPMTACWTVRFNTLGLVQQPLLAMMFYA